MSYLSVKVREHVEQPGVTAASLERLANVPGATIAHILRDCHPRPERLAQLLRVLPPAIAQEWLVAYLRDDVPDEWQERVQILIDTTGLGDVARLAEAPTEYGLPNTTAALDRLTKAMEKDPELGAWFVRTVNLILGPG